MLSPPPSPSYAVLGRPGPFLHARRPAAPVCKASPRAVSTPWPPDLHQHASTHDSATHEPVMGTARQYLDFLRFAWCPCCTVSVHRLAGCAQLRNRYACRSGAVPTARAQSSRPAVHVPDVAFSGADGPPHVPSLLMLGRVCARQAYLLGWRQPRRTALANPMVCSR